MTSGSLEGMSLELEWVHMGDNFTNAENTASYEGHDVMNLRAEVEITPTLTAFAIIRNLTNTDYAERAAEY